MSFYLIDYENLKKINGFDTLTKDDTVIFFYSQTANTLTFDMHIELGKCLAEKEYFFVENGGKNALDFQLSTCVGIIIAKHPEEKIFIISKDKGFENVLSFAKKLGFETLKLASNICENTEKNETVQKSNCENTEENETVQKSACENAEKESVASVLMKKSKELNLSEQTSKKVEEIVNNFKTKQAINNNLMKLLRDSDKVGRITKQIKPFLKNKK